jgi:type IV pilus assembly protein PilC
MSDYYYVAVDPQGSEKQGTLQVCDQSEVLRRIREMGLFPIKVLEAKESRRRAAQPRPKARAARGALNISIPVPGRGIKPAALTVFTRQLATLVEAGMPLLRSLRTLEEQEENRALKRIIGEVSVAIEGGSSLGEAISQHPKVFNSLYLNLVRAGEIGGALELTLKRLAEFMEKARKLKGKIKAAMFYPCAVLVVAAIILAVLMVFVVPRFKQVFDGLLNGTAMPAFTVLVLRISEAIKGHLLLMAIIGVMVCALFSLGLRTKWGRWSFDRLRLMLPVLGPVFRKAAISRFARTLGTLVGNGVPILQALTIVKDTAGNVIIGGVISSVHENVKQGEPIAPTLKASGVFPAMVAGMVDVGEQTGALPEMLMKIADTYDDEVDNAASAMTSLLEPIMIVILAVIVGSIVIALFLPLVKIATDGFDQSSTGRGNTE